MVFGTVKSGIAGIISTFLLPCILLSCAPARKEPAPLPDRPLKIASMAPACTSILAGLGLAGSIIAVDSWSAAVPGISAGIPRFDMMKPDVERLAALECDLLLVSAMTREGTGKDPFKPLSEAGVRVEYIPTSKTLADIRSDVTRIAELTDRAVEGKKLIQAMDGEIEATAAIVRSIPESRRRTVVFEISGAPSIYSFGSGVYLDELLTAAGAVNALGKEKGWIAVSAETIVASDPDVILTNVGYIPDPVAEILNRPGWDGMQAVRNGRVYFIDNESSSQPTPYVTKALREIAEAVYPEYFK
jgi:iron complex transport system substrate-binding protein